MITCAVIKKEIHQHADKKKAAIFRRFFKTGKGEYGEGDIFVGLTVPQSRIIVKRFKDAPFSVVERLLKSKIHEERLIALLILVSQFEHGDEDTRKEVFGFYMRLLPQVNNWDLVDSSAHKIVGRYLFEQGHGKKDVAATRKALALLKKMAYSKNVWERRVAIIAPLWNIQQGFFEETIAIAELLVDDIHDLIHKAVGWMLREVGKRDQAVEENFLKRHYKTMPRTMLRYAIERFPESLRKKYLAGTL